jgi:hypothetical protein
VLKSRLGRTGTALTLAAGLMIYAVPGATAGAAARAVKPGKHVIDAVGTTAARLPPAPGPAVAGSSTVTMVTGDRVRLDVTQDGTQSATVLSPAGGASTFTKFNWHGDQYVIPASAVPYLSSVLDPRLFDVSYLARAHLDDAHSSTLPVTISYTASTTTDLPGVHVTSRSGTTATATVTKAQSSQLGRRLLAQWRAARTSGSSTQVGALPGVAHIQLAPATGAPQLPAAPASPPARPRITGSGVPYRTLTIKSIDQDGKPGAAVGFVQNIDDPSIGLIWLNFPGQQGAINLSVPQGNYSLALSVMTGPADDESVKSALVMKPQVAVDADETVTLDARTAKPYQVATEPANTSAFRQDILTFTRTGPTGSQARVEGFGFLAALEIISMHLFSSQDNGSPGVFATPTTAVTKGTFNFDAFTQLAPSESTASAGPRYYLTFPHTGTIPSSLSYTVNQAAMTTAHQKFDASACAKCTTAPELFYMNYLPWAQNELGIDSAVLPGERTDYLYSSEPKLTTWQAAFNANDGTRRWGARRTYASGQQFTEEWNRAPLVPSTTAPYIQDPSISIGGSNGEVLDPRLTVCPACRQDTNAMVYLNSLGDSDPSHYAGDIGAGTSTLDFYRNGTLALSSAPILPDGQLSPTAMDLPMLATAANYRLDWVEHGPADPVASIDANWTFHSGPADTAAKLGPDEKCAPDTGRRCSFLPLLFVRYDLALNGQSQAKANGPFSIVFTVAHQQYQSAPVGPAATVSVSYDDGKTWSSPKAAKSLGGGRFSLAITHPSAASTSGFVSLRVAAHDSSGNTVTQTNIRAYALTS